MGHQYYRQAKFIPYRFKAKDKEGVNAHEQAYLESKQVETFSGKNRHTLGPTRNRLERQPTKEVFCQCWECLSVMTTDAEEDFAGVYGQHKTAVSVMFHLRKEGWNVRITKDEYDNTLVWKMKLRCDVCQGLVEVLTVDGVPNR